MKRAVYVAALMMALTASAGVFDTLMQCRRIDGAVEAKLPVSGEWKAAEEGRGYPLGTYFRCGENGSAVIAFGKDATAEIGAGASFGTRAQPLGILSRTLVLAGGEVKLNLPPSVKDGLFTVTAPGFSVKDPAGKSYYKYTPTGDGDEAIVRCVTGVMAVEGRHFTIPQMRAADEFRIRTSHDNLETIIYGLIGDYIVKLDRGIASHTEFDDEGNSKVVSAPAALDWHLSPETKVQINRAVPSIGERMSVAVMTFDAAGNLMNNFAFAEGRAEVNTGELVAKAVSDNEDAAKTAEAETTEEIEETAEIEEESSSEDNNNNNNESSETESESSDEEE